MKNFKQFFSFIILIIALFAFSLLPQLIGKETAFSATFANPTTQLRLVGYNGYQPSNYFDSLARAKASAPSNYYYNPSGSLSNTYNVISANNTNLINERSTGSLSFTPFNDYIALANKNVLYAYAQTGIVSGSGTKNDITISISHNQKTYSSTNSLKGSKTSEGYYSPHYFKTTAVLVKADKEISFSFTNNSSASLWGGANFNLFEPSIFFETRIDKVSLNNSSQTVYANDILKLEASNAVLDITETGTLISHYKQLHKIEYEIVEGADKASVIGNYIYFTGKNSGTIKLRAKALKNSDGNEFIYSQTITYNYIAEEKTISVTQNFPNSANIVGTGKYYLNQSATLIATMNNDFIFSHWLYNGEKITSQTLNITVKATNNIQLYAIRNVRINQILIKTREYDGTTSAEIDEIVIDGLLASHDAKVTNLQASYFTASAGTKILMFNQLPKLEGEDAQWYRLSETIPNVTGTILQRNLNLKIDKVSKVYGDIDPELTYVASELITGDNLNVTLSRTAGENVGSYQINAQASNLNYKITIQSNSLTILKREVELKNTQFEKEYDKNTNAIFSSELLNLQFSDNLTATINAKFSSYNVQNMQKLKINNIVLNGNASANYFIDYQNLELFGSIYQKQLLVQIENQTKVYGETDKAFSYSVQGLIDTDNLQEKVTRNAGENVGTYSLGFEIQNSNYIVLLQGMPRLYITQKPAEILANYTSKVYGNADPEISYQTEGVLSGDTLSGSLSRSTGENVGIYNIVLGTLKNNNYNLTLISNYFEIIKLELNASLTFQAKIYDGTKDITNYNYSFSNIAFNDNVSMVIEAEFESANVGENVSIIINSVVLNNSNYSFLPLSYSANIMPRSLYIYAQETSKIYGEQDPKIAFVAENLVKDETLNGELSRVVGENIGNYQIELGTLNKENNSNYNVILSSTSTFIINKRNVNITTLSQEKYFGGQDPAIIFDFYSNDEKLAFDDTLASIISGNVNRVAGEAPGRYSYLSGNIFSLNNNYTLVYIPSGALTVLKANIVVTGVSTSKVYGEIDPILEYETNKEVIESFEFNLIRDQGENVGTYKITYLSLYHEFYNITYQEGFLSILPRALSVKPIEQTKFYGDNDPQVAFTIVSGILINGDTLNNILSGKTIRTNGENVGKYEICVGDLQSTANYSLTFVKSTLTILKQEIEIVADSKTKQFGQADELLSYKVQKGFLAFGDKPTGSLERYLGEELGNYIIKQGSFGLNQNYNLTFIEGIYTIVKAQILITAESLEKEFGNIDPEITFEISGNYYSDYALQGSISREVGEEVGQYNFVSTLNSPYYEISYNMGTLTINKRLIKIQADSYTITYGQAVPELEYNITFGTILEPDTLSGNIYKVSGNNAGQYDINSTLNLGRNYQIEYTKGTVTILPINLKIISKGASKIYGQSDPVIPYTIFEGSLLNGDVLTGKLSRAVGEDIGVYQLVPAFTNPNYSVEVLNGKFEITEKSVTLYIIVDDKVFNGSDNATIRKAEVIGLIDSTVSLYFDKNTSAKFAQSAIGNQIKVFLSNIFLIGEKSYNYILEIPEVFANITHNQLENNNIKVYAQQNTQLTQGTALQVSNFELSQNQALKNQKVVSTFNINLINNNQEISLENDITISVELNSSEFQNVKVYLIDENNNSVLINSNYKNGNLTFSTSQLGNIVIVSDNLIWLDIFTVLSVIFLTLMAGGFATAKVKKYKQNKK